MDTTPRTRTKVVTLREHTSKTQQEIAQVCGISKSTCKRILKLHSENGTTSPRRKGKCGRKSKTSARDDTFLHRLSVKNPRMTSSELNQELEGHGVLISDSTVRRRLLARGRRAT